MILRRLADAIKRQDWFVVFIELLIVIFGVYIGIYLGDIQTAQQRAREINLALQALESELRSDLVRLDEVIAVQTHLVNSQRRAIEILGETPLNQEELGPLLVEITLENDTFFPNRAAYSAMQTQGYLAELPDEELRLRIARMFEREFVRQEMNASAYDTLGFDFANRIAAEFWDRSNSRLLSDRPDATVRLRNGMQVLNDQGEFYLRFITGTIKKEILAVLDLIDAYQEERAP